MIMELPAFKYHPDPVKTGSIEHKETDCPVCGQKRAYVYVGPFYSIEDVEGICPWCIADGSAARKHEGEFQDSASIESPVEEKFMDELVHRTPGYMGWQQERWLVHCDEPCIFIGYVGWKEIQETGIDVTEDLEKQAEEYSLSVQEFCDSLVNKGLLQGYLFKCVRCGKYRLTADSD